MLDLFKEKLIMIELFKVAMAESVKEEVGKVLTSGWIGEGPQVKRFEQKLKARFKNNYCLALNSGTGGLRLSLELLKAKNRGKGRVKVVTSPISCFATIAPVLTSGLEIVWADIKEDTLNIDPERIEEVMDSDVLAILFVHWGGYAADLIEISNIAKDFGCGVIEDAAHCFDSTYHDSVIGDCKYSDYAMISFQAIKHLTTGDGGALFLRDEKDYELGKLLRWFGIDRDSPRRDLRCEEDIHQAGFKFQMNDIAATIGLENFKIVDKNLSITKDNVLFYRDSLKNVPGVKLLQTKKDRISSNWIFTLLVEDAIGFARKMGENGIMVSKVHARIDKHSCVKQFQKHLPVMDYVDNKRICIPCGWWVTKEDREKIVHVIKEGW